jgi:hypothetical protein
MKLLKVLLSLPIFYLLLVYSGTSFSSCTKQAIRDTTIVHDTTTIRDTIVIKDTLYDITEGLVAYYNFNGGNLYDSSGNGNNISYSNATTAADRFGRVGNAYSFNGATSYMQVPNSSTLNPASGTFMAIVKVNSFYSGQCVANQIFGKGSVSDEENGFYCLRFTDFTNNCSGNPPNPAMEFFNSGYGPASANAGAIANNAAVKIGQWYTVIYTYDNQQSKIYVNGVLAGTNTTPTAFIPNSDPLFIGKDGNPTLNYNFNGVIDEIRIYNRALTTKEVAQLNKVQE